MRCRIPHVAVAVTLELVELLARGGRALGGEQAVLPAIRTPGFTERGCAGAAPSGPGLGGFSGECDMELGCFLNAGRTLERKMLDQPAGQVLIAEDLHQPNRMEIEKQRVFQQE